VVLVNDVVARLQVGEERADRDAAAAALGMPRLAEAEDLGIGEHAQAELRDGEAFGEADVSENEGTLRRHLGHRVAGRGGHVAVREQLGEPRRLRRRDHPEVASGGGDFAQEGIEPSRVRGDATPPQSQRVGVGPHTHRAVLVGRGVDAVARHIWRRESADREALLVELGATLLGLRLMRVVREAELDRVLEHDGAPVAEMIEQRCGRAERGRERVGARSGAALAQRLHQRRVRLQLVLLPAR
jgi:hypothetical protein